MNIRVEIPARFGRKKPLTHAKGKLYHDNAKSHDMPPKRGQEGGFMNELFNLVGEYREVYNMLTDPEIDEETVNGTLEAIMGEIEVKAEGLIPIFERLDMEIDACKKHKDEWAEAEKVRKNRKARLWDMVKDTLVALGKTDLQAGDMTLHIQNAGGKLPLIVDPNATVPERFTKLTIENDNELIRKALDNGEELDFAHYGERSKVMKIKK